MKKSTNKVISLGLAGISVASPILDSGISVLAVSEQALKNDNSVFSWVDSNGHQSKIELLNDSTEGAFWFTDDVTKTLYAKGGTYINFIVNEDSLSSPIKSIELLNGVSPLGSVEAEDGSVNLKLPLADIPSYDGVSVVFTFEDGSEDAVPFYDYFKGVGGGVTAHVVDSTAPEFTFEDKIKNDGIEYDGKYFKGKLKYSFQTDVFSSVSPNIWGTTGYKFGLSINGEDYSDSKAFVVDYNEYDGKANISIDFSSLVVPISGECNIEISVLDTVGNESKYTDTVFLDYTAPSIEGTVSANNWSDTDKGIVYFNSGDSVEVGYTVSDSDSGVKSVTILKDSVEVSSSADTVGSFIIDSDGVYEVKVEDNIGNVETYGLSDIVSGLADTVKFDTSVPTIDVIDNNISDDWFKGDSSISVDISDDIALKNVKYTINGEETSIDMDKDTKSYNLVIDSSKVKETSGVLSIGVIASDMLGKEFSYSHTYNVDLDAPSLVNGVVEGDISVVDGIGYSKAPLTLKGDIVDKGSGVDTIGVLKDGYPVSGDLPYVIDADGEYTLRLSDNIGNISEIALKDIVGKDFSKIVIDGDAPSIDVKIDGNEVSDKWYKDSANLVVKAEDNKIIKSVKYVINGKEVSEDVKGKNHEVNLNLEDYVDADGLVNFEYIVEDCAGNETSYSNTIKVDTSTPVIDNASLSKDYVLVGNSAYIDRSVVLSADITASNSSIAKVEILRGNDVVGTKLPYTITESGTYSIRVTDNAGHEVIKTLADLVDSNINELVVDSGSPVIEVTVDGEEVKDSWYKTNADLVLRATDTNIKSVSYSINGVNVNSNVNKDTFEYTSDLVSLADNKGKIELEFTVEDFLGNIETYNKVISIDTKAPIIDNPSLQGTVSIRDGVGYASENLVLNASLVDNESGIAKIEILNGGNVVADSLPYTIEESGSYSLRVTDGVGHVVEKSFKDLTGLDITEVVIDKNAPVVKATVNGAEIKNGYYKDKAKLSVSVSDSSNIKSIKYSVNGNETVVDVGNDDYSLDLDLVPLLGSDGLVDFTFYAVDSLGNETSYSKVIKVDVQSPVIENGALEGDIYELNNIGYIKDGIVLKADISDAETSIASIEVLRGTDVVSNSLPYRIDEDGSYSIRVTDGVGHVTTKSLKELTGLNINSIVIDKESPIVEAKINNKDVSDDWYKDDTRLVLSVSDSSSIKSIKYSINGTIFEENVNKGKTKTIVDLEDYVDSRGYVDFKYTATDCLGNVTSYNKVIKVDTKAPRIENATLDKDVFMLGNIAFVKNNITLQADAFDDESGVAKVEVLRGFEVVSESLPYTIDKSGIYSVRVTDNAGHTATMSLKDILKESIDNIVVDNDSPNVKATIGGKEVSSEWYKDTANMVVKVEDTSTIKSIRYNINGIEFTDEVNSVNYETSINLEQYVDENGVVNFSYWAVDNVGNETSYEKVIKVDTKDPIISDASLEGDINIFDRIGYINGKLTLSANTSDKESGISSVEVYKDGSLVSTSLPYDIVDSGSYSVKVTDGVGHSVVKTLKELTGVDVDSIIVDKIAPVVSASVNGESVKSTWYKDNAKLALRSEDTSPTIVKCTVNGVDVGTGVSTDTTNEITIDLEKYVDAKGLADVVYTVTDCAGNKKVYSKVIKVDIKDPTLENGRLDGDIHILDGVAYINKELILSATSGDSESGITSVEVLKDGVVVSNALPYTISDSGSYSVRVTDGVGHSVVKTLKELTGLGISKVVFDSNSPIISRLEGFVADTVKDNVNWYRSTPNLKLSVSDDNIKSISIKVNGNEVINSISADGVYNIPIDNVEGAYSVSVDVVDKSENTSSDRYDFKVDFSKPSIDDGVLEGDYKDRGYGLYFSENPVVSLKGTDLGIGVKEYVLLDDKGSEIERNAEGKFTLGSGEYFAKTVDYFGNESDVVSIKDLCNLENNRLVIDSTSPSIESSRPEGDLNGWFNKNVSYNVKVKDGIGVNNAKVYINDILVDSFTADTDIKEASLVADTSKVFDKDGAYSIKVVVEDNTGFISEWSDTINIDTTAPSILEGEILGNYVDRGDSLVFQTSPSLKITSLDEGVGVKSITLIDKDGNRVTNTDGLFELSSNEYSLILEDNLGNISNPISVQDACNLPSNKIVIDSNGPIIESTRPDSIVGNWFKDDVEYNVSVKDDTGISLIKVFINDSLVGDFTAEDKTTLAKELKVSTEGVPTSTGAYDVRVLTVDVAGNVSDWSDMIYIDTNAPTIDSFVITGQGYKEGSNINSSDKYGFYINGKTDIEIHVSDGNYSSGMDKVYYSLISSNGTEEKGEANIVNGVANVSIDKDFKGYITAYATDKVGNIGASNRPDGIISESGNTHLNTSKVDITLPSTSTQDAMGYNLYNDNVSIKSYISDSVSGIRKVVWGIGDEVKGTVNIDNNGNMSGDTGSIISKDKNLVVEFSKDLFISNNENNLSVWVEVEDRVGHVSKNSRYLSIDKDAPIINVSYDTSNGDSFYNKNRVATVSIKERNFRSSDVKFSGVLGSVGEWTNIGDDTWVCNVVFSEDNDYQWSVAYTDMAGNIGNTYNSEKFTVDKTAPSLNVSFNNNNHQGGNFYKENRVATITVVEKNFDSSLVKLEGNGSIGGWSSNGDVHTANVVFDSDGEYEFSVNLSDKAGNTSSVFSSGKFIIDKTAPTLNISGVQNGVSYKKNTGFKVSVGDTNIDAERCVITLSGRSIGEISLIGGINGTTGEFSFQGVPEELKYDDLYTLKAVVYDKAGNVSEQTLNYSINRYGSHFTFLAERLLNNIVNKSEDVVLEETSVDRLDTSASKVVIIKDGQAIAVDSKYVKIEEFGGVDSNWVYRYTISKDAFDSDGKYQVQIFSKALDGSSNSSLSQEYAFVLDTSNPEVIISGIEEGVTYREVSRRVAIEVRDLSGVKSIKALLNGKEVSLTEEDGVYYLVIPEQSSKQDLVVEVTDNAGNVTSTEVKDFFVTTNLVVSVINSTFAKVVLGGLGAALLVLIGILLKRRRDSKREELELAQEHAKMYQDTITGGSTNSGSNSTLGS